MSKGPTKKEKTKTKLPTAQDPQNAGDPASALREALYNSGVWTVHHSPGRFSDMHTTTWYDTDGRFSELDACRMIACSVVVRPGFRDVPQVSVSNHRLGPGIPTGVVLDPEDKEKFVSIVLSVMTSCGTRDIGNVRDAAYAARESSPAGTPTIAETIGTSNSSRKEVTSGRATAQIASEPPGSCGHVADERKSPRKKSARTQSASDPGIE
jgi:hypothetical protein